MDHSKLLHLVLTPLLGAVIQDKDGAGRRGVRTAAGQANRA